MDNLIGVGLYTPAEAGRLLRIRPGKIVRWLRGHCIGDREYKPLWRPQIDLNDGHVYLGFRDLMEARIADKFIGYGISPQRVRGAIETARGLLGDERPLSTDRFRTDGRSIFFQVIERDERGEERVRLLNLFRRQYEFRQIIEPLLKTIEFNDKGVPSQWWPLGRRAHILVDPEHAFGQPIDAITHVPTAILAAAGKVEGLAAAARGYDVPPASIKRAMEFEAAMERQAAA